jgi:hypothetical protein
MIFFLAYLFLFVGVFMAGFTALLPITELVNIPDFMRIILFLAGFLIAFVSVLFIQLRAIKTGLIYLLDYGKPDCITWFYIHKDGNIKICPAFRDVEGFLYSKELDTVIKEMKSYRLFDHSVRFVPEAVGHAVDLDMCLYAHVLKKKWGYANIATAREGANFFSKKRAIESPEFLTKGMELDKLREQTLSPYQSIKKRPVPKSFGDDE